MAGAKAGSENTGGASREDAYSHPIYRETRLDAIRGYIRRGEWTKSTRAIALGHTQAGFMAIPRSEAFDFMLFCQRNPKPCPLLDVSEAGQPIAPTVAPTADLRTDIPKYRVFRHGELVEEVSDVKGCWRDDLVGFVLGCSLTFDAALLANDVPNRQLEERGGPTIYWTNIQCRPVGKFSSPMAVSMRPMLPAQAIRAVQVTSRFPWAHGAPLHIGDPSHLGIRDINQPDVGIPVTIKPGEVPVFWACVATVWEVAIRAKLDITITHAPGCMFITDVKDEHFSLL
jgi:uncharacterized protein YcsI (UPF0317 family)